ncbi:MAG TPA: hypothetical protein IAA57_01330 [Candidatus Pullilachnospira intestinigallinarum]|nr:hypothetical protein [Candidatus Pullilachnospira intestinigallinarum]
MQWMPLQDMKTKKWVLCVMHSDHIHYERTEIVSDSIETILSCADYMNGRSDGSGLGMLPGLKQLKEKYPPRTDSKN